MTDNYPYPREYWEYRLMSDEDGNVAIYEVWFSVPEKGAEPIPFGASVFSAEGYSQDELEEEMEHLDKAKQKPCLKVSDLRSSVWEQILMGTLPTVEEE